MNRHFLHWRARLTWAALFLVPVLALAQNPIGSTGAVEVISDRRTTATDGSASIVQKPWRLRLDFSWVNPSGNFNSTYAGWETVGVSFDTGFGAGLRGEYQFSRQLGVELGVLAAGSVDVAAGIFGGTIGSDVGVSGFVPVTLGLNVHLTPNRKVDLYAGPLLTLVRYNSVDVWTAIGVAGTTESIETDTGWGASLGLDVPLGRHGWMVQANLRYIDTDMKDTGGIISFNSKFDPVIFSVGVGYRF